jgi:prolipoprotein diacylglyceryltransferase
MNSIFAAMNTLSFLIWNGSPEIFTVPIPFLDTQLTLRWYGLLFALGFLISQQLLYYMFKKEGKPETDVDTLTVYMVIATIIGARLGHVFFYEPERYLQNPIDILKIWEGGLASHGAAVGILFALWLYARKKKAGQNYMQTLDRIVILVAMTGALIRFGNFFNSEIIGKPTNTNQGVFFARNVSESLMRRDIFSEVSYVKDEAGTSGVQPIKILCKFNEKNKYAYADLDNFLTREVSQVLRFNPAVTEHINQGDFAYKLAQDDDGTFYAILTTLPVPRHPAQLYEAISCVLLFVFLFWIWTRHKEKLPEGRIFGIFMIVLWSLRFGYEFLKENQVAFENDLPLNMGQILSIPLVLVGVFVLIRSYRKTQTA